MAVGEMTGRAADETARLDMLRATGLLDSETEEAFDRLTRLAVRLVGVPSAFISLVDEHRDFYKSTCGFGEPLASLRELTGPTFCHHAIDSDTPLVIPDTQADPRYRDIPTVRTLGVAAYVGVPLIVGGQPIGSFCAIDSQRRDWTAEDIEVLSELAASAQREVELRLSVRAAAEQAARLRSFIEAVPLLAWMKDSQGAVSFFNQRWYEYTGRDQSVGKALEWVEAVHPDDQVRVTGVHEEATVTRAPFEVELRLRRHDGVYRWHMARAAPILDGADALLGWAGGALDLEDRRRLELELRESEARFRAVQDASPNGSMLLRAVRDRDGTLVDFEFTYANEGAHRILLERDERIVGRTLSEFNPDAVLAGRFGVYARVMASREPWQDDVTYARRGVERTLRVTAVRVDDGLHLSFTDMSDRVRAAGERERLLAAERTAHAEAERAREEAERANAVKAQFLATMSHELRTPLNAIGGYAQLIELGVHGPVTPAQSDALARIQRSQRHLVGLISEVLSYAKLEAGAATFDMVDLPALEIVRGVEALIAPQARVKEIVLTVDPSDPDLAVRADPEKARQIVLNLVSNAVKFTGVGGRVTITRESRPPGVDGARDTVAIQVTDSGRGIPAHDLGRVFDAFTQVGRKLTSDQAGTGLGLTISRDLARGMGGDVTAVSEEGVGSTFTLTLPRA